MNVLLLRPRPHRETIGLQNVMICEPLELEYLAAALLEAGHRVEIVDLILDRRPLERITAQFQPRLVGITGYVAHVNVVKALAARVKALVPGVWVAVGGVHAEVVPRDWEDPAVDFILTAGGGRTLTALADALEQGCCAPKFTTHASITARPFFEGRGYRMVRPQVVQRRGVLLLNYVMEKEN